MQLNLKYYKKWAYGGLNTDMMLALIDATSTENDQKLQMGFNALDSCSNIRNLIWHPRS
jgi:hypothetical protein